MFDIGWSELLVIGVVALIVVGPEDLPKMFRTLGKFTARARAMAREFQDSLEAAAKESGVSELANDLKKATSVGDLGLDSLTDATKEMSGSVFDPDEIRKKIEESGEKSKAPAKKRASTKKPADKKGAGEKASAAKLGSGTAKKPAPKKTPPKKPATKKAVAKKPAAKAKPAAVKKPAAKKTAAKKPAAKADK